MENADTREVSAKASRRFETRVGLGDPVVEYVFHEEGLQSAVANVRRGWNSDWKDSIENIELVSWRLAV